MLVYGLTRKQCGVVFANWKKGNIEATETMIKWMYDIIQDSCVYVTSAEAEYRKTMKNVVDHIFAGDYESATASFQNAFGRWNIAHKCDDYK